MTQEEKELLLKDLCGRLPYGVKCRFETTVDTYKTIELSREGTNGLLVDFDEVYCYWLNEGFILPYLRPMSSMTEDEEDELNSARMGNYGEDVDWLNAHHFDYRIDPSTGKTLTESGLALKAPENMYKNN